MNLPNQISLFRFVIHIFTIGFLLTDPYKFVYVALIFYIVSALLDKVDGIVARKTGSSTEFGRFFDGTVDKVSSLTIMATFACITNEITLWFFLLVLFRDLTVEGLRQYIAVKGVFPKGQMSGKVKVFLQMVLMGFTFLVFTPFYQGDVAIYLEKFLLFLQIAILTLGFYSLNLYFMEIKHEIVKEINVRNRK